CYNVTSCIECINSGNISFSAPGVVSYGTGSIALGDNYAPSGFTVTSDTHGGTDVSWTHQAPIISTSGLSVIQNSNRTTTVSGLQISDSDAAAPTETFAITATTEDASSGTSVSPSSGSGLLSAINTELAAGITYNPGATPPATDMLTLSVVDGFGATHALPFVFASASNSSQLTLAGTAGNDVIFATGHDDTLQGGGGVVPFAFNKTTGAHNITDFSTIDDHIDLTALSSVVPAAPLNSGFASNVTASTTNPADTLTT